MSVGPTFDLLLQGGRVIDPGSGTDGLREVAIRRGSIRCSPVKRQGGRGCYG